MKYRRKPEIVEAEQWFPGDAERDRRLGITKAESGQCWLRLRDSSSHTIFPGWWIVRKGDWIGVYTHEAFVENHQPVAENTCERCGNSVNERDTCMCEWVDNEAADAFHADP